MTQQNALYFQDCRTTGRGIEICYFNKGVLESKRNLKNNGGKVPESGVGISVHNTGNRAVRVTVVFSNTPGSIGAVYQVFSNGQLKKDQETFGSGKQYNSTVMLRPRQQLNFIVRSFQENRWVHTAAVNFFVDGTAFGPVDLFTVWIMT